LTLPFDHLSYGSAIGIETSEIVHLGMRGLIVGVLVGAFGAWVYRSERAREQFRQQVSSAPAPVRQRAESLASAAVGGSRRIAGVVDASPLPPQVKDRTTRVAAAVQSAVERARGLTKTDGGEQPAEQPLAALVDNPVPEEVLAEEDAAARAAADALREQQAGA